MKRILFLHILIISIALVAGCTSEIKEEEKNIPEQGIELEEKDDETNTGMEEEEKKSKDNEGEISEGVFPGDKAYDFTLEDMNGTEVSLSDYEGKVVFLNFWASWCPPCQAEMPYIQGIYNKYKDSEEVAILTVNITKSEKNGVSDTIEYMEEKEYNFPVLLDKDGEVSIKYRVANIPTTYIIDKDGIIYNYVVGPMSEDRMLEQIEKAME